MYSFSLIAYIKPDALFPPEQAYIAVWSRNPATVWMFSPGDLSVCVDPLSPAPRCVGMMIFSFFFFSSIS